MTKAVPPIPFGSERTDLDKSPLEIPALLSPAIWRELRTFLAVAKSPSFSRAAELLGTSAPTVSRDVKRLQDQIGSQLVISTFSGVTLTEMGRKLAMEAADLDFKLFVASNDLKDDIDAVTGRVVVSVTSGLAVAIVAPSVSQLSANYPRLSLDIKEQVSLVNFEKNQADLMVSLSSISRADVDCIQIGTLHLIPVASREYVKRFGIPLRQSIPQHAYIQCKYYDSDREIWNGWRKLVNTGHQTHHCENSLAYFALIKNDAGVGLLGNYVLADPELVPLDLGVHVSLPIYLISAANRRQSKAVGAVYDWLVYVFSTNPSFKSDLTFPSGRLEREESLRKMLKTISSSTPTQVD
ncbi:LysR family transcriptional regulator [Agrobacterium sp. LAD9]|uniref:LysR family transcriptional regulator n=1 Tax=Agrobacterium sp. LAD9 TaxID=2055153 RepID=UPI000D1E27E7|nr:LysR family transcriptional regulator [Agrobacterium sp. LAD9]